MGPNVPQPGQAVPGAPDCRVVLESDSSLHKAHHRGHTAHMHTADSARDIAGAGGGGSSRQSSAQQNDVLLDKAAAQAAAAAMPHGAQESAAQQEAAAAAAAAARRAARPRTYYVDWLRAFLTVVVVLHHCVTCYQSSYAWAGKRNDTALWLLSLLFVHANQAYFMTLFFFLSGLYVPGSYKRKGAPHFLWDRTLRLVLPCIVYSFLAPPFILMWNELAKNPSAAVGASWAAAYRAWLRPGWPTTYVLPTGPPWFVWMLWCFNVAYVLCKLLAAAAAKLPACRRPKRSDSTTALNELPTTAAAAAAAAKGYARAPLSNRQVLCYASCLALALCAACYGVRMLDTFVFGIRPTVFVQRGPFVSFMPDYLPVYGAAFVLGVYAGPSGWDVLARLPAAWGPWCLWTGGVWWLLGGWLLNVTLHSWMSMQRGAAAFALTWLLRTFVEQSFCVFWSLGLLVLFRQAYNVKPGWAGRQFINGAYGAYLVHLPLVYVFARFFMPFPFPSAVVNATIIAPMAVAAAWLVACLLRAIPGADRVL